MNSAQRCTLLAYGPAVRRAWHHWYKAVLADGQGERAAQTEADRRAQAERNRLAKIEWEALR